MSRETFIQSEDKEFEVTFREVRNWDEYSDLDFEADTAPLTDEEAGTAVDPVEDTNEDTADEAVTDEEEDEASESEEKVPVADGTEEDSTETGDVENTETDEVDVDAEEEIDSAEVNAEDAEEETAREEGTSEEAVLTVPVEDNFEAEPAWEETVTGDEDEETVLVDEDPVEDEELPVGEPAEDTESFGASLESIYKLDNNTVEVETQDEDRKPQTLKDIVTEAIESGAPVLVGTVRETEDYTIGNLNFEKNDNTGSEEGEVVDLNTEEAVELDPYAFTTDVSVAESETTEVDTFEAISTDDESLNKADTVEEIPAVYSEDTLPETVAIETVDAGDYFSFDDIELDADEDKTEAKEETPETSKDEEAEDDEELSLELDYSDEDN